MPPEYAVPALEKALDILETLAETPEAMSQLEIALAVDRSPSQIFRVLTTLERRGYLYRDPQSGAYSLSLRLFDLSHRQEPLRSLTEAALGPMRELAAATGQSCNLSVREGGGVRVVAQVESPADFGFRVRVGALFPLETTATGAVLAAFAGDDGGADADADARADAGAVADAGARIRADGHLERSDSLQPSITDLVFPVLNRQRVALAALTVPYVATSFSTVPADRVRELTSRAAAAIGASLGL